MKITLICSGGMSTSMLVKKMEESAQKQSIAVEIRAFGISEVDHACEFGDIILLGPQIGFQKEKVSQHVQDKKVCVINSVDYGMMNGEKVLAYAINELC